MSIIQRYAKIKALACLLLVTLPYNGLVKATDKTDSAITVTTLLIGGGLTIGLFKYVRDVILHWSDRRFIGECERTFLSAQKRYERIASSYHHRGMDGLRDFIVSREQDALHSFDRLKKEVKQTVDRVSAQMRQLDNLESKAVSEEERSKIVAQMRVGSEVLAKFQGFFDLLRQQKEPFFLELLISLPLPSKDLQNPFQTMEYVQKIDRRIAMLKRYGARLQAHAQIYPGEALLLEKANAMINNLENIIRQSVDTVDYKQELRLKKDADLAEERLKIERKQLALKKEKIRAKQRLVEEIERRNRLESLRQKQDETERERLEQRKQEAEEVNQQLDDKLRARNAYIDSLQNKIAILEHQREAITKELEQVRSVATENNRIQDTKNKNAKLLEKRLAHMEDRLQQLDRKISRLKHLIDVPPMNPQHPDYLALLQKQIRDL